MSQLNVEEKPQNGRVTPMRIGKNGPLIDRSYSEAVKYQYVRELVENCIQAGATEIKISPDWNYLKKTAAMGCPTYRFQITDNSTNGMGAEDLVNYLNKISASANTDMGRHGNFGVGAKISCCPWNPHGFLVMSFINGVGNMIRIVRDPQTGEYGLFQWDLGGGIFDEVAPPPPEYHRKNGTTVILMGRHDFDDTFLGPYDKTNLKGNLKELNARYFSFPEGVTIDSYELKNADKKFWPEYPGHYPHGKRGGQYRKAEGQVFYAKKASHSGTVSIPGAVVHWFFFADNKKEHNWVYGRPLGTVGALYQNEIYNANSVRSNDKGGRRFFQFGIIGSEITRRTYLFVEPDQATDTKKGVYPNTARSMLLHNGSNADQSLPWSNWGVHFKTQMPAVIRQAMADKNHIPVSLEEIRKKIDKKLIQYADRLKGGGRPKRKGSGKPRPGKSENPDPRERGGNEAQEIHLNFDNSPEPPRAVTYEYEQRNLCINIKHPIYQEHFAHWCLRYANVPQAELKIMTAITEICCLSVCSKIIQADYFKRTKFWSRDDYLRGVSDEALTVALMGIVDIDQQLGRKLSGYLGKTVN